jgi:succinate dehydrogenase / fumarate reductase membrane anchor subunit
MSLRHPSGSGATLWFLQRITGVVLVLALAFHFGIQHFWGTPTSGVLDYATVAARFASPFYKAFGLIFVVLCIVHGLNGVWMVTEDFFHKRWQRLAIWSTLATLALVLLTLAIATLVPVTGKV